MAETLPHGVRENLLNLFADWLREGLFSPRIPPASQTGEFPRSRFLRTYRKPHVRMRDWSFHLRVRFADLGAIMSRANGRHFSHSVRDRVAACGCAAISNARG